MVRKFKALAIAASCAASMALSAPAFAVVVVGDAFYEGSFSGMDCPVATGPSGGFSNCWATTSGVTNTQPANDPTASLVVAKFGEDGEFEKHDMWTTFTEDDVTIEQIGNLLHFTYHMDPDDPLLTYITIKQAQDDYALFYNATGFEGGTTYTFDLSAYFTNADWSHLTVYDSVGAIPEPGTWAMMLIGFGGIGYAMRRRRKANGGLLQIA